MYLGRKILVFVRFTLQFLNVISQEGRKSKLNLETRDSCIHIRLRRGYHKGHPEKEGRLINRLSIQWDVYVGGIVISG